MKTIKRIAVFLECINKNLNTLILNQEKTYFAIQAMRKKIDALEKDLSPFKAESMKK